MREPVKNPNVEFSTFFFFDGFPKSSETCILFTYLYETVVNSKFCGNNLFYFSQPESDTGEVLLGSIAQHVQVVSVGPGLVQVCYQVRADITPEP